MRHLKAGTILLGSLILAPSAFAQTEVAYANEPRPVGRRFRRQETSTHIHEAKLTKGALPPTRTALLARIKEIKQAHAKSKAKLAVHRP